MAEKRSSLTFSSIMSDLKAGKYAPIYLLMGEEPYYIDRIADYIAENVLQEEERDFNQTIVYGLDTTAAQIADAARGYPMMAQYRVIIVKEAQAIKSWEPVEKYLDNPLPSTILVVCHKNGTVDRRKKFASKAQAVGVVFESKKKRDNELPAFIEGYLHQRNASIDHKAAMMMTEAIGADLNRLTSELDKLLISLPEDAKKITPELVEEKIGVSKDYNIFELRDAIVRRDVFKANAIVKYLYKNPKAGSIYSMLPILFNFFQNLMIAHYAPNKSEGGVAQQLGFNSPWAAKDYLPAMRNYTPMKTLQIISKMREIDAKSKGLDNPNTGAGDLMKELIFFILH